ncbi:MFS transporter, partial [Streptomyces phaeochromogenes]
MSTGPGADSAPAPAAHNSPSAPKPRSSMFSSLKIRNYRLFFTGQVVSNTGTW